MAMMLARLLCDNGHRPLLIGRPTTIAAMAESGESRQLPGMKLPPGIELSDDTSQVAGRKVVFVAVPTQHVRDTLSPMPIDADVLVSCSKGIECSTGKRPTEVLADVAPGARCLAVLSGPNIAEEVVSRKPAGAVIASENEPAMHKVRDLLATDYFRIYTNADVAGVELAGATKNIIALAAGVVDGLGLGDNAKASLITRGLVEITRLGTQLSAAPDTFSGLAGMGDLITTCFSPHGRNRRVGERIGQGERLDDILDDLGSVCEGVPTTRAVLDVAQQRGIDMPIAHAVSLVLSGKRDARAVLTDLMTREPKAEA